MVKRFYEAIETTRRRDVGEGGCSRAVERPALSQGKVHGGFLAGDEGAGPEIWVVVGRHARLAGLAARKRFHRAAAKQKAYGLVVRVGWWNVLGGTLAWRGGAHGSS